MVTVGTTIVTCTLPDTRGSKTEVAIIYKVLSVSFEETVSIPLLLILVPCVTDPDPEGLELTLHVTLLSGLFDPVTAALNCNCLPNATSEFSGSMFTKFTETTLIGLESESPVSSDTAKTYITGAVSLEAAFSIPSFVMYVPGVSSPMPSAVELIDHCMFLPVALKRRVPPRMIDDKLFSVLILTDLEKPKPTQPVIISPINNTKINSPNKLFFRFIITPILTSTYNIGAGYLLKY